MSAELAEAKQGMRRAFAAFDIDESGFVTQDQLSAILTRPVAGGNRFTVEEAEALFGKADLNGDGVVDYDEFSKAWAGGLLRLGAAAPAFAPSTPMPVTPLLSQRLSGFSSVDDGDGGRCGDDSDGNSDGGGGGHGNGGDGDGDGGGPRATMSAEMAEAEQSMRQAFAAFDIDESGFVTQDQLSAILTRPVVGGNRFTVEEAERIG